MKIAFLTFYYICFTFVSLGLLLRTFHLRKKQTAEYLRHFCMTVGLNNDIVSMNKWRGKEQNIKGKERRLSIYVTKILADKIKKRCHITWFISFQVDSRMYILASKCQLMYLILCVCQAVAKGSKLLKVLGRGWLKYLEISMEFCKVTFWGNF